MGDAYSNDRQLLCHNNMHQEAGILRNCSAVELMQKSCGKTKLEKIDI